MLNTPLTEEEQKKIEESIERKRQIIEMYNKLSPLAKLVVRTILEGEYQTCK